MRLRSMAIFGIGYVVGTRAGRDRYEQITGRVRDLAGSDVVRGYAGRASELARRPFSLSTADDASTEEMSENGEDEEENGNERTRARARRSK